MTNIHRTNYIHLVCARQISFSTTRMWVCVCQKKRNEKNQLNKICRHHSTKCEINSMLVRCIIKFNFLHVIYYSLFLYVHFMCVCPIWNYIYICCCYFPFNFLFLRNNNNCINQSLSHFLFYNCFCDLLSGRWTIQLK